MNSFIQSTLSDISRRFPDRARWLAAALVLLAAAFAATPAQAQPSFTLVSNLGKANFGSGTSLASFDIAQGFTTGSKTGGYVLDAVVLDFANAGSWVTVQLATGVSATSAGTTVATLINPATLAAGNLRFTAPAGTRLSAGTQYFVVVQGSGSVWDTASKAEDAGAAAGWSIADETSSRNSTNTGGFPERSTVAVLKMRVDGYAKAESGRVVGQNNMSLREGGTACAKCPVTPTGNATPGPGPGEITVRWAPGADTRATPVPVTRWKIFWANLDFTGLRNGNASATTRSWIIPDLVPGREYRVEVRALEADEDSPTAISGIVRAGAAKPPGAPSIHTITSGPQLTGVAKLSVIWSAPTDNGGADITNYELRYYAGSADPTDEDDWVEDGESTGLPPAGTSVVKVISGLKPSTAYRVQVRAVNSAGEGPWSASANGMVDASTNTSNHAPVILSFGAGDPNNQNHNRCTINSAATPSLRMPTSATTGELESVRLSGAPVSRDFPLFCQDQASSVDDYDFHDEDGLTLRFSTEVTLPANVLSLHTSGIPYPRVEAGDTAGEYYLRIKAVAVGQHTDVTATVTYLADDADSSYSQKASASAADKADAARQTFAVRVAAASADGPSIDLVRIVSHPTHNAGFTGTNDTYIAGDEILVDVEYSEPVEVVGGYDNVRLRLDLGTDDTTLANSREVMKLKQVLNGGRTLRFAYTVEAGPGTRTCSSNPRASDCDTDGIWVQTANLTDNFNMIFLASDAKVRSVATGVDAGRVRAGLPTSGDGRHKVDGGRTGVAGPVPDPDVPATIDGRTLTVTFDKALHTSVDTGQLMYYLSVHGAGDVSGGNRNADQYPDGISIGGTDNKVLTLTLSEFSPASASDIVTLSYSGGTNLLRTATGNHAAPAFRDLAVTNITGGGVGPLLQRASVAGHSLRLVFDAPLDTASLPAGNTFRVNTQDFDGDTRNIGGAGTVSIDGSTVTVGLAAAVRPDEIVSVSYTPPATGKKLQSATYATAVKAFSGFQVETVQDFTAPTRTGTIFVRDPAASTRTLAFVYFDEALDTSSVPDPADFAIRCCTNDQVPDFNVTPFGIAVTNNAVKMELPSDSTAQTTEWKFAYTPGANPIRDLAGNAAAKIAELDVTARGNGKPIAAAGGTRVDGAVLTIDMGSEPLDPGSVPDPSAFTLHDTDTDSTQLSSGVESVLHLKPHIVYLRLEHPIRPCDGQTPIRIKYTKPTGSNAAPLQGIDGSDADSFTPRNVMNERHSQCRDGRNWLSHMTIGSVVIRANRPFATDKAPKPEWFTVKASGGPVTVTGAAFDPSDAHVLKLELSREFTAGETVTASYRRPAGESGLWDVDGNQLGDVTDWPVLAEAPLTASFHGLPEVHDGRKLFGFEIHFSEEFEGLRLTALKRALSVTGGRLIDVKRTVRGKNQSVTVRVRPSQSGDLTLALAATTNCSASTAVCAKDGRKLSAVSATVPGPDSPGPITAEFHDLPAEHDGRKLFAFEIRFSEEFSGMELTAFEEGALEVTGGRVVDAKRVARGENRNVTVRVRPSSHEDMTLTLLATEDCSAADAICSSDGRKLSETVTETVQGPVAVSVADAQAREGADAALEFAVTLSRAASGTVTVDYVTRNGTARAGEDYTATSGTLAFAVGDTEKTIEVPILDDALDEGKETFTLRLRNARGAAIGDGKATGTIVNSDPLQKMWLSRHR